AIDIITKKMYDYGDRFYLDSVRPTAPNYTIFRMEKITDNKNHEQQADGTYKDYVEEYGRNQKELNEQIDKWKSQGYELKEAYELKDLIRGGQFDKLTERQLMNLAEQGHIELTEPVLQRLRDAIKSGNFNQHTIKKRHIRGLHFTPEEFESNLHRFGDEVLAAKRQNAIIKMN